MYLPSNFSVPTMTGPNQQFTGLDPIGSPLTNGYSPLQYTLYLIVFMMLLSIFIGRKLWQIFRPRRLIVAQTPVNIVGVGGHELDDFRPRPGVTPDTRPSQSPVNNTIVELDGVVDHQTPNTHVTLAPILSLPRLHTAGTQAIVVAVLPASGALLHHSQHGFETNIRLDDSLGDSRLADISDAIDGEGGVSDNDDGSTADQVIL